MSFLARFAPHLPYLRRYARALTGDQTTADNYVRVTLQAVAAGESSPDEALPPRTALYHIFHAIWRTTGARLEASEDDGPKLADHTHRLQRIAPRSRQAFLLTALEGFTLSETAQILDADFPEVEALVAQAQAEIDAELATTVLIIEDEPVIAADIEALVRELGHDVTDIAATRREAMDAVARKLPGLVLADIQLADGSSGIDAVKDILALGQRAGDLHHRLSRTSADRRAPGTDLPDHQAVPTRNGEGGHRSGAVLSSRQGAGRRLAHEGLEDRPVSCARPGVGRMRRRSAGGDGRGRLGAQARPEIEGFQGPNRG